MNGRLAKLIRRTARDVAGSFRDNPPTYTFVPGSVRQKLVYTGQLLSNGLPEVIPYQTVTLKVRDNTLRSFINEEKRWQRNLGTSRYIAFS